VNDMIGSTGMLRGWAMLWNMELLWLLPMVLISVAVVALMEALISTHGAWSFARGPHPVWMRGTPTVGSASIAIGHNAIVAIAGGPPDFTDDRAAPQSRFQAGPDDYELVAGQNAE